MSGGKHPPGVREPPACQCIPKPAGPWATPHRVLLVSQGESLQRRQLQLLLVGDGGERGADGEHGERGRRRRREASRTTGNLCTGDCQHPHHLKGSGPARSEGAWPRSHWTRLTPRTAQRGRFELRRWSSAQSPLRSLRRPGARALAGPEPVRIVRAAGSERARGRRALPPRLVPR